MAGCRHVNIASSDCTESTVTTVPEGGEYGREPLKLDLLYSEDLVSWTVIDVTALLGPEAPSSDLWINQIVVSDESVYFTVSGYNSERNETSQLRLSARSNPPGFLGAPSITGRGTSMSRLATGSPR